MVMGCLLDLKRVSKVSLHLILIDSFDLRPSSYLLPQQTI